MLNVEVTGSLTPCEGCALSKAKAKAVPKFSTTRATHAGERLCTEISGPYKSLSLEAIIGSLLSMTSIAEKHGDSLLRRKVKCRKLSKTLSSS